MHVSNLPGEVGFLRALISKNNAQKQWGDVLPVDFDFSGNSCLTQPFGGEPAPVCLLKLAEFDWDRWRQH